MAEPVGGGSPGNELPDSPYNKEAVLLAYPGEGHGLRAMANRRDLTVRYFEFFDHYLKGAPAPKWLSEGIPYLQQKAGAGEGS